MPCRRSPSSEELANRAAASRLRLARRGHRIDRGVARRRAGGERSSSEWPARPRTITADQCGRAAEVAGYRCAGDPFNAVDDLLESLQSSFRTGALVIDVTVPMFTAAGPARQSRVPRIGGGARQGAPAGRTPARGGIQDDSRASARRARSAGRLRRVRLRRFGRGARADASAVAAAIEGLRPVDVGPLSRARSIEHLTLLRNRDQPHAQDPRRPVPRRGPLIPLHL